MVKYLLDTNICIYLINAQPEQVLDRFKQCRKGEVAISSVTWAELSCGLNIHNSAAELQAIAAEIAVLPFDISAAAEFGKLSQAFPARKSSFDRMIAAHAIALDAVLVTNNVADFSPYPLRVENWSL